MNGRPAPRWRSVGWAVTAMLALAVGSRLAPLRSLPLAIGVQAVERRALLAAYPVAVIALLGRSRALGTAAALFIVRHLIGTAGSRRARDRGGVSDRSLRFRLVTANVLCSNPDIRRLADDIADEDADVVVLQEVTPAILAALRESPLWAAYPHRAEAERPGFHGAATLARFPISFDAVLDVAGSPLLQTDLDTPRGVLTVVNVHTVAPLTRQRARLWERQMVWLAERAEVTSHPLILAGDFNATGDHRPFRQLLRGRARDVFEHVGRGSGATWPSDHRVLPRLLRLDHVVVTDRVEIDSVRVVGSPGSDHARVVAVLGLKDADAVRDGSDVREYGDLAASRCARGRHPESLPSKGQPSGVLTPVG